MREPFYQAKDILLELKKHGHKAFFVGGAVRDALLGKEVDDVDITTSATPEEVLRIFPKTIPVGIEHGTVIVRHNGCSYEVTTFRTEAEYEDFRRPASVSFITSLESDLSRRDFTMNAIAMTEEGEMVDPFSGQKDLTMKMIRTVGNPKERFQEDPLRMMRAIRFLSQLSFQLDNGVEEAITAQAPLLRHISIERIAAEFEKLIKGRAVSYALEKFIETGLYQYVPVFNEKKDALVLLMDNDIRSLKEDREYWALLIFYMNEDPELVLRQWKRPSRLIKEVKQILASNMLDSYTLYQLGLELSISKARVLAVGTKRTISEEEIKDSYQSLPIHDRKELQVSAADLIQYRNKKPGPWLGNCLAKIEQAVVERKVKNSKAELLSWLGEENE
ncbi:CCA tRNA nucleotidyltransferase [Anaerobacillus sp. MEB173]|uniref:CCA tRNA nucleotidyltransferase n=1 Tax=Anaerobacillus sp. MEB173 TaxID=3383345 RepID=UPI003F8E884C